MPTPNIVELMVRMEGLQQMVETLVEAMAAQRRPEGEPQVERGPWVQERQVETQEPVRGVVHVSFSKFVKLQPLTFSRSNASKDPQ